MILATTSSMAASAAMSFAALASTALSSAALSSSARASAVTSVWADSRLVYAIAVAAVLLLAATIWLFRRSKREGRGAGLICLVLSLVLHGALVYLVPYQAKQQGGSSELGEEESGVNSVSVTMFDPSMDVDDAAGQSETSEIVPLPIAEMEDLFAEPEALAESHDPIENDPTSDLQDLAETSGPLPESSLPESSLPESSLPESLSSVETALDDQLASALDSAMDELLLAETTPEMIEPTEPSTEPSSVMETDELLAEIPQTSLSSSDLVEAVAEQVQPVLDPPLAIPASARRPEPPRAQATAARAFVPGADAADFANRSGSAKQLALTQTGGTQLTEAAVQAALRFLARHQRQDGAWDPRASGAGVERRPLGESRPGAGTKCETGITGLALLAMMGSGNTHLSGPYSDNVYEGLAYLIGNQAPDGSLGGDATLYARTYCHSMASLSLCEAAALTRDPSAMEASKRAIRYTNSMQHPVTGGWRYTRNDRGDLSQLGWQAMVLDAGRRAGIAIPQKHFQGVERFLGSIRVGRGGLACYRPGEATSRTMTAEALATRLLMGEQIRPSEINEAEQYLLRFPPGTGQDNYYYWYYATLALHQLQDESWQQWNEALKRRLLATQRPDGSWPASTVWGGYGGTVYTTAMATLCLETYYRHQVRATATRAASSR